MFVHILRFARSRYCRCDGRYRVALLSATKARHIHDVMSVHDIFFNDLETATAANLPDFPGLTWQPILETIIPVRRLGRASITLLA